MKVFRPLQLSFVQRVLEQDGAFHFVASATLGVNLATGEALLELDAQSDAFECMGARPLPDLGMPKPQAEFLVSGSFHATDGKAVPGGEVRVRVGTAEKSLYVFGPRYWNLGLPSEPAPIVSMPIDYAHALGGKDHAENPEGIGVGDGLLPCIEDPARLVTSSGDRPGPAGLAPLDPGWPQRMRFQGTYDAGYLKNAYPGYPADFDWRYFMSAPEDQWREEYFHGNESIEIWNMHPEQAVLRATLPGLHARCFLEQEKEGAGAQFAELPLNLDTLWLFPEEELALLIWRGGIRVADDEAEQIAHVLLAYEDRAQQPRDLDYYGAALERRRNATDALLDNLDTRDLCPAGAKGALQLMQERALVGSLDSEFAKNLEAKGKAAEQLVRSKVDDAVKEMEASAQRADDVPQKEQLQKIKEALQASPDAKPDADTEAFKKKLEAILPGITSSDPKKLQLEGFSFDKIDQIMAEVTKLLDKKQGQLTAELDKARQQMQEQLAGGGDELPDEQRRQVEKTLRVLEEAGAREPPKSPLPRVSAEQIAGQMAQLDPQVDEALQHLQSLKQTGGETEDTRRLEELIVGSTENRDQNLRDGLRQAEQDFRSVYIMAAHFQPEGLSPHEEPEEAVAERFLKAVAGGRDVSWQDWACIDLHGQTLDGIDLSGAYLEQIDLRGASLKGANLAGAILARANLEEADLSGANLEGANVGGVRAWRTRFNGANLKAARLSKGDFTGADFGEAELEDTETLEIVVNGTSFAAAHMPGMRLIEAELKGTSFAGAQLEGATFMRCTVHDADFTGALAPGCTWADVELSNVRFDEADLTGNCFAASEEGGTRLANVRFAKARLDRASFQDIPMQGTDLSGASCENANFAGADLSGADLTGARARQALFRKARLSGATLDRIDLMEGSLAKAHLVSASFVGANLHAVDFLRSTQGETDFRDANLEATLIRDWRPS